MPSSLNFSSKLFQVDTIELEGHKEQIVKGGRHLFPLLPKAFAGVKKPWPERARRALAGADGTFRLEGLAAGRTYHLWADLPGHPTAHNADIAAGGSVTVRLKP
jgi:ketol-acid reductoisomerase